MSQSQRAPVSQDVLSCAAKRALGFPNILVFLTTYASSRDVPSVESLAKRMRHLFKLYPFLACKLVNADSDWFFEHDDSIDIEGDRIESIDLQDALSLHKARPYDSEPLGLLAFGQADMAKKVLEDNRPWQITRITSSLDGSRGYLVVSIQHILADGMGALNLTHAILDSDEDIAKLEEEDFFGLMQHTRPQADLPRIKERFDKKNQDKSRSEVTPPSKPAEPASTTEPFPKNLYPLEKPGSEFPARYTYIEIPPETVASLSALGKQNDVSTVTPIFNEAMNIAFHVTLSKRFESAPDISTGMALSDRIHLTPMSHIFGGPVMAFFWTYNHDPSADFWQIAAPMSRKLRNVDEWNSLRQKSRDSASKGVRADIADPARLAKTYFGPNPYNLSIGSTSLNRTTLPPDAIDFAWVQDAQIFVFAPIVVECIGHTAGVRITAGWRDGHIYNESEVKEACKTFKVILKGLLEGKRRVGDLIA